MQTKNRLGISVGALAPTIQAQLTAQHLSCNNKLCAHFQKHADAITQLQIAGILGDADTRRARLRLLKKIAAVCI